MTKKKKGALALVPLMELQVAQDPPRDLEFAKTVALNEAKALGYDMGPFEQNGDVWISTCQKSLCLALVFEDGRIDGVATKFPCPEQSQNKFVQFTHDDMSPEFRARITRAWRPPSEG